VRLYNKKISEDQVYTYSKTFMPLSEKLLLCYLDIREVPTSIDCGAKLNTVDNSECWDIPYVFQWNTYMCLKVKFKGTFYKKVAKYLMKAQSAQSFFWFLKCSRTQILRKLMKLKDMKYHCTVDIAKAYDRVDRRNVLNNMWTCFKQWVISP